MPDLTAPAQHAAAYSSFPATFSFTTSGLWVTNTNTSGTNTVTVQMIDGTSVTLTIQNSWSGLIPLRVKGVSAASSGISVVALAV
jgi:hypothetical protein